MTVIALDAMGGDHGPSVVVPAAHQMLLDDPDLKLILVGQEAVLKKHLAKLKALPNPERLSIHHASEVVEMNEPPAQALRGKKDSSMRVAINLVAKNTASACVSAGNTGALMATARFVLKMIPGIDRPAICGLIPTSDPNHPVHMLDLGANVDCNDDHLTQFALMGSQLASVLDKKESPSVGLLNVGEEEIKGNEAVKLTAERLKNHPGINYIGFVEGNDIFKGHVDVIVCDGFVGNVALKTTEGVAKLISKYLKAGFEKNIITKLCALLVLPILKGVYKKIDPARYNGASFLGLRGIVVKSHGGANVRGYMCAIKKAKLEAMQEMPIRISAQLSEQLTQAAPSQLGEV